VSTFVIRLIGGALGVMRGTVRHVRSGEQATFASASELMAFIEEVSAVTEHARGVDLDRAFTSAPVADRGSSGLPGRADSSGEGEGRRSGEDGD
jgi:hypothetical protein